MPTCAICLDLKFGPRALTFSRGIADAPRERTGLLQVERIVNPFEDAFSATNGDHFIVVLVEQDETDRILPAEVQAIRAAHACTTYRHFRKNCERAAREHIQRIRQVR